MAKQGYQKGLGKYASEVKISEGKNDAGNSTSKPRELDWDKLRNKNGRDSGASYKNASK
jgi:hypothetical protein